MVELSDSRITGVVVKSPEQMTPGIHGNLMSYFTVSNANLLYETLRHFAGLMAMSFN